MGLMISHDGFDGAYSAFNRVRQFICHACGGSYPTHYKRGKHGEYIKDDRDRLVVLDGMDENRWYVEPEFLTDQWKALREFLSHSDCDGDIKPKVCKKLAKNLESLLPKMIEMDWEADGHIVRMGGYVAAVERLIKACRQAARLKENLRFR